MCTYIHCPPVVHEIQHTANDKRIHTHNPSRTNQTCVHYVTNLLNLNWTAWSCCGMTLNLEFHHKYLKKLPQLLTSEFSSQKSAFSTEYKGCHPHSCRNTAKSDIPIYCNIAIITRYLLNNFFKLKKPKCFVVLPYTLSAVFDVENCGFQLTKMFRCTVSFKNSASTFVLLLVEFSRSFSHNFNHCWDLVILCWK